MRYLPIGAAVVVGGLLLGLVLIRLLENGMIFHPARYPLGEWDHPQRLGVSVEELDFRTADGLLLHGWWFASATATDDGPVVLWAHGNAGNLTGRAPHAQVLADEGVSVFLFDYRGYGRSEGEPDEEGIYQDTEAAYEFLTEQRQISPQRVVLLGRSLGSAPAARLSTRVPHAGMILVSPLPSAKRMARRMFAGLPVDWFGTAKFPVIEWVAQRKRPLLVIHGNLDQVVPLKYGREVFAAAAEPKEFLLLEGVGHNDILLSGGRRYLDRVVAFARAAVAGR